MSLVFAVVYVTECFICYFQVSVWQLLTMHVIHPSVNVVNLLGCYSNELKFLIMVSYTILQRRLHTLLSEYH